MAEFGREADSSKWSQTQKFHVIVVTKVKIDVTVRVSLLVPVGGGWVGVK